jgi:hypothetical protein
VHAAGDEADERIHENQLNANNSVKDDLSTWCGHPLDPPIARMSTPCGAQSFERTETLNMLRVG